ncbi:MAG: hypothetical protein HOG51_14280, partial [Gammaproteobacteria bacterium]|nr:hypothetical protein [Gammaproteobacteria bacterium]
MKQSRTFPSLFKPASLFILLLALAACGGDTQTPAGTQQAAVEQQTYEWKLITSWPKNLPALGTSPEHFSDIVEEMSGGRMKIRV